MIVTQATSIFSFLFTSLTVRLCFSTPHLSIIFSLLFLFVNSTVLFPRHYNKLAHNALNSLTSGAANTVIGRGALDTCTTGGNNTVLGYVAGDALSEGHSNIIIGYNAGVTLTTGTHNILIGLDSAASATGSVNQIVLGNSLTSAGNNTFAFGKTSEGRVYNNFASNASWTRDSDERLKTDIQDATLGLNFINNLKTKTFKWKPNNELPETLDAYQEENVRDTSTVMHGMIAQEVKAALDTEGVDTFGGWAESSDGSQSISQEMFIHPLIKAVQELTAKLEAAEARIETLEG